MKVGFITTLNTNIGDDFIRQGITNILKETYKDRTLHFIPVNKHHPYTVYPWWHPLRYTPALDKIKRGKRLQSYFKRLLRKAGGSKFDPCDLIIQSGAPVLWPDCQLCEWNIPIWQEVVGRLYTKIPVFNVAAGSCYPWTRQPVTFPSIKEEAYAKMIGGFCKVTTTRDRLANSLFSQAGVENTMLPCSAFFVSTVFDNPSPGKYILVNYMEGGGHFDWGQNIDKQKWEHAIQELIQKLGDRYEIRFICHDEKEVMQAKQIAPSLQIHFPKNIDEYIECIKDAIVGINNRMHASVAMASLGVPAISVCTDTRLLMLDKLDLPIFYVEDLNGKLLLDATEKLLKSKDAERARLFKIKREGFDSYKQLFKKSFD